jgi:hypothetical protein
MESRALSLAAFYGGPVWKAHSAAANATMIDSDNVLLLRPARDGSAFALDGERGSRGGFVLAVVCRARRAPSVEESAARLSARSSRGEREHVSEPARSARASASSLVRRLRGSRRSRSRAERHAISRGGLASGTDVEVVTRRMNRKEQR